MDIVSQSEMIFRNDYNGRTYYTIGLSKKRQDGTYEKGYMPCRFRKGVEIPNMTKIMITKAWMDFYTKDKKTFPQVFISEFEYIDQNFPTENVFEDECDNSDLPF